MTATGPQSRTPEPADPGFTPSVRAWFDGAFAEPTPAQVGAWAAIREGAHTLVVAPTGSGKTLAAFLSAIDTLVGTPAPDLPARRCQVLYLSPLKALAVDVERNLRSPLTGIGALAAARGTTIREITVAVRSGDTPSQDRRSFARDGADILITTPESLFLILTSRAREMLVGVRTVIVDEVHAVAGTKRGAHLAVSLDRLDLLLDRPAQRIGLSATVRPLEEVARFLAGGRPVVTVRPPATKSIDVDVVVPVPDMAALGAPTGDLTGHAAGEAARTSIWPHVEERVVDLVTAHRSTIVFANSRRLAERLTARLNEIYTERLESAGAVDAVDAAADETDRAGAAELLDPVAPQRHQPGRGSPAEIMAQSGAAQGVPPVLAMAHHGSVSREQRSLIEERLKTGMLPAVVATSSLELGVDMGAVDLVVQVEAPPSVASGLQRIGRAGHQVGAPSHGVMFPKYRGDLLSAAVVARRMRSGQIEALSVLHNPLDIAAQQIVAVCAMDSITVDEVHELLRRSAPFAGLGRGALEAVLDMLSGRYPSEQFAELRPRLTWDRVTGVLTGRPGAQRLAVTSGGTIPDRGLYGVFLASGDGPGRRVGELDEEMVYESRVGDVFALGSTSWQIVDITHDQVRVLPAPGLPGRLPFWKGDTLGRPAELGRAHGEYVREVMADLAAARVRLRADGLDQFAVENLVGYLSEQRDAAGMVPDEQTLLLERFRDELGDWRLVLHSPYGAAVHAPWALVIAARMRERYGVDVQAMHADDGIVLRLPDIEYGEDGPEVADLFVLDPETVAAEVTDQVGGSAVFAARFRECAARALLLPRRQIGRRQPLWQQRQRASQLLQVASEYPSFPIVAEAVRECLQDVFDVPSLVEVLRGLSSRSIRLVELTTQEPSPFAKSLLFGYVAQFLYEGDSPLAERRAAALTVDPALLAELLGGGDGLALRDLLDPAALATVESDLQRLSEPRRARSSDEITDLLRILGPLTTAEIEARSALSGPEGAVGVAATVQELQAGRRAIAVRIGGQQVWADPADAGLLRDALGTALPPGIAETFLAAVPDPLGRLLARYARTHGPFLPGEAAARFGLGVAVVTDGLRRLAGSGRVAEGEFRPLGIATHPGVDGSREFVDADVLRLLRRRSLAALRAEVEPVPAGTLGRFLPAWNGIGRSRPGGSAALVRAVEQLAGAVLPASALESLVLPARVRDYQPALLDELMSAGEVIWTGHGALGGDDGWISLHLADSAGLTIALAADSVREPGGREATRAGSGAPGDGPGRLGGGPGVPAVGARVAGLGPGVPVGAPRAAPAAVARAMLAALGRGGAFFFRSLVDAVRAEVATPVAEGELAELLWQLAFDGLVSSDTLGPVRARLAGGRTAHRPASRSARTRARPPSRLALLSARGGAAATSVRTALPPAVTGRWSLVPVIGIDPLLRAQAAAEIFLDRYGVVTRGAVTAEDHPGGFAAAYRVLSAFEEAGRVRRGYFVEGLGAAQFATPGAVDRLRSFAGTAEGGTRSGDVDAVTLAAADPANPYGAALPWPDRDSEDGHRPARRAGAVVVLVDGELVLYAERGGRTLLSFSADPAALGAAARALAGQVRGGRLAGITVTKIDGASTLSDAGPVVVALQDSGFVATPRGLRLRAGAR